MECFLLHPIVKRAQWLRCFIYSTDFPCPARPERGHDEQVRIEDFDCPLPWPGHCEAERPAALYAADPRWPKQCKCGFEFEEKHRQLFPLRLYADANGRELVIHSNPELGCVAPPGAMWWETWLHDDDGKCWARDNCDPRGHLVVRLPNGSDWDVMGRASNCPLKNDRNHFCWVMHGEPPMVTVDKAGRTCAAGAGSILSGNYHGFLRNGRLT